LEKKSFEKEKVEKKGKEKKEKKRNGELIDLGEKAGVVTNRARGK